MRTHFISTLALILMLLPAAKAQTPDEIRNILDRVVAITAYDEDGTPLAYGSGFVIDSEGRIATCLHVIKGSASARARFVNKEDEHFVVSISAVSAELDLAVLRIDNHAEPLLLGDSSAVRVGDAILAFGNPQGLEGTVSKGIVSGLREINGIRIIQISAPISPGSSGGPVVDEAGQVIGIASASLVVGQNLNFAVPIDWVRSRQFEASQEVALAQIVDTGETMALIQHHASSEVKAHDFRWRSSSRSHADIAFSIENQLDRDINNIRLLVLWKKGLDKVGHSAYLVTETIPANNARVITKRDEPSVARFVSRPEYSYEVRILDFDILESSGELEFR